MSIFKCKMCGGALEINNNETVATCEYCGTKQTLPRLDDDKRANLYDRANHFRRNNEFDKAMGIYENILNEDSTDAEAYWSLVLCRYGIEYVEDPSSHKRVPTVNRAQFTSVFDDDNYKSALQYADGYQRGIYEEEAKAINEIQKGILAISQKEEPFDVFICYKETDDNGRRTPDSVLANDLYHQLTQEGFKVFFARITLEDKLGTAYEPYIFAALNSAKVMVVLGTKPAYFNAVWVKNEWSRYLSLIKNGAKKILIPAYKDMDPYDLPEEFSHLQAQDMSKLGFMQDLIRGIKKIAVDEAPKTTVVKETVIAGDSANTAPLLKRAFMFLEDGDWTSADEYCEKVLDIDPENAQAYLGKLMAELKVRKQGLLKDQEQPFDHRNNYQKAIRFADEKLKTALVGYIEQINTRNDDNIYTRAKNAMSAAQTESAYKEAAHIFESINKYKDSAALAKECYEKAKKALEKAQKFAERFKAYKSAVQKERSGKTEKMQAERRIEELTKRHQELIGIRRNWNKITSDINSYNNEIQALQTEIAKLNMEKAALGFFAGKRKKEISAEIAAYEPKMRDLRQKATASEAQKGGFSSLDALDKEISQIEEKINAQNKIITEISNLADPHKIREELISSYPQAKERLKKYDELCLAEKGEYITFGAYEQDNNSANGKEDIEWLVLTKENDKMLVISKYALDGELYNTSETDVTWETCSLRKWLNDDFINSVFSAEEKDMISTVTVPADKNPKYSTNPGNATTDKVFLLSIDEVNRYFGSDEARKCVPTAYAIAIDTYTSDIETKDGAATCWWWLRSPGGDQYHAACVTDGGAVSYFGDNDVIGVRPALWINLGS